MMILPGSSPSPRPSLVRELVDGWLRDHREGAMNVAVITIAAGAVLVRLGQKLSNRL